MTGQKRTLTAWRATIAVAMSNYIEAGAIIALATGTGLWQEYLGFDNVMVGLIAAFSANAFGSAIGALLGGPLSDRYGRKFIYTYDLILFMLGAGVVTFATNLGMLFLGVILMGIAVGAGVPAAWTYIAESAPDQRRAAHVGMAQLAWSIGPAIGFLLAVLLEPFGLMGSRIIFAHLFVIAFITWWVRRGLSESSRWLEERQKVADGERPSYLSNLREMLSNKKNWGALLFLVGVYAIWNTVAAQAGIFQPRVYEAAGLTDPTVQNLLQVLVWSLTSIATYFGFMLLADKVSRRWLYFAGALLGMIGWVVLIFGPAGMFSALTFAITWGISAGIGAQAFYGLWAAELFPTRYRATAQGILFMVARVLPGFFSLIFPVLLGQPGGITIVGVIVIALLLLALLVGTIWAPNTQGRSLEDIERERFGQPAESALSR